MGRLLYSCRRHSLGDSFRNDIRVYENSGEDGILTFSNHFQSKEWGIKFYKITSDETVERACNLLSLGKKHKGRIDVNAMKQIMDTSLPEGGATAFPPMDSDPSTTVYQVVALPSENICG